MGFDCSGAIGVPDELRRCPPPYRNRLEVVFTASPETAPPAPSNLHRTVAASPPARPLSDTTTHPTQAPYILNPAMRPTPNRKGVTRVARSL